MPQNPSYQELQQKFEKLQSQNAHLQQEAKRLADSHVELSLILDHVPLVTMIVDRERKVRKISRSFLQKDDRKADTLKGLYSGNILRCVHHLEDERGCGYGSECQTCVFRNTVLDTLSTGQSHHQVEIQMSLLNDSPEEKTLLVSTALLENSSGNAIVFVEDVTRQRKAENQQQAMIQQLQKALENVKQLSGLVPICASCKKIRDDKGYWKQIESYIADHSEAVFSHGICPECREKLYGKWKVTSPDKP